MNEIVTFIEMTDSAGIYDGGREVVSICEAANPEMEVLSMAIVIGQ